MPGLAGVPIVALSASAFDITRSESEQAGADGFLAKPVKLDEVVAIMGRLLGLEWTCKAHAQNGVPAVAAPPAGIEPLPAEVVDELHRLALMGDVRALTERLDALEREQRVTPDAIDALRGLARNYDMKAIRAYLRPEQAVRSGGHVPGVRA
jgi:CheY-like chemotaxis protein